MAKKVKKISVWNCPVHGEVELIDWTEKIAYCPHCGTLMTRTGEYEES